MNDSWVLMDPFSHDLVRLGSVLVELVSNVAIVVGIQGGDDRGQGEPGDTAVDVVAVGSGLVGFSLLVEVVGPKIINIFVLPGHREAVSAYEKSSGDDAQGHEDNAVD